MKDSRSISIIIPTITGREEWLKKCRKAYKATSPGAEIIEVKDEISCGHAWQKGSELATRPYLHFTADDITPSTRWWVDAMKFVDSGAVPAANVRTARGLPATCDSPLGDMGLHQNILVPFLSRSMVDKGGWFLPIHYGSDDWITYWAVHLGYEIKKCPRYRMIHHVAPQGRDYTRRPKDVVDLVQAMKKAGYVPPVYALLAERLKGSVTGLDSVNLRSLSNRHARQMIQQINHRPR